MNLPLFIARRYFFAKKKTNFINIITRISMAGVCVGSMSLIIVLSVFNGMEDLFKGLYSTFSSEIQIKASIGKTFYADEILLKKIKKVDGVEYVSEVLEDNALLIYRDAQMVVKMRGIDEKSLRENGLQKKIISGNLMLQKDSVMYALLGSGVQYNLSIPIEKNIFYPLEVVYPKNRKRLNFNSPDAFNRMLIRPAGVFAIEQKYDADYIFVPLQFAREVLNAEKKCTFIEVKITSDRTIESVQRDIEKQLGNGFVVQSRDEQNGEVLKAIKLEKFFVYITLTFIIAIASFNIFFSLMMLAIDKQKDISILYALGASQKMIKSIFISEGGIIAFSGAILGLILGVVVCLIQEWTGIVTMGMATSVVEAYPVKLHLSDIVVTTITIIIITISASYFPALKAAKSKLVKL